MTSLNDTTTIWLPGDDLDALTTIPVPVTHPGLHITVASTPDIDEPDIAVDHTRDLFTVVVSTTGKTRVTAVIPTKDAVALWQPGSERDHARIPASWEDAGTASPFNGVALGALLSDGDRTIITYGADAGDIPIHVRAGIVEETAEFMVSFEIDAPADFAVRLDVSGDAFADAVNAMSERLTGPRSRPAPADEKPVLCTWYFLHQEIDADDLIRQAAPAAHLGFGSLIVDDGWQTDETERGYGSAGDWSVEKTKIPDATALVDAFSQHGIRTMWWIGTPFLGHRSDAIHGAIPAYDIPALDAAILDPRLPASRRHLVDRLTALIRDTGAHGVKIDFLDRFASRKHDPDIESAALTLLDELNTSLQRVRPGLSIEFREPYFGPAATSRATMIRVGDCPMSPVHNRTGIIDLRLATNGIAVHADPVMWADDDTPERVAQHLQNTLFGVPQVSVDLATLRPDHENVLAFWLDFACTHQDVLLHGDFRPERPDLHYPVVTAVSDDVVITARYQPAAVTVPAGNWRQWNIVNADNRIVDLHGTVSGTVNVTVVDAQGHRTDTVTGPLPERLVIPTGGLAIINRP